jgi:phenylalanyl-tRNA synthetase alpha chain
MNVHEEIEKIKSYALEEISKTENSGELENSRVKYLGRNGNLTQILRGLEKYPEAERKIIGAEANKARIAVESEINKRQKILEEAEYKKILEDERLDVTAAVRKISAGRIHPITRTLEKTEKIFSSMGFEIVEGPEIETEFYNFDALNIPQNHPARDMWDTFWLKPVNGEKFLMRTHTSPVQVRYMETHKPPFRIIVPGRVFRHEATDSRHESAFYQLEGLMVGADVTLANIKSIFEIFFSSFFGTDVKVRLRPSYFPFVEPGIEGDISCAVCQGKGCRLCKGTGWLEMFGAGMVNQKVFVASGYPENKYQGFAFGFGLDRFPMMQHGIDDIRLFHSGDLRFLKQF